MILYWHNLNSDNNANDRTNYSTDQGGLTAAGAGSLSDDDLLFNGTGGSADDNWTLTSDLEVNTCNFSSFSGTVSIGSNDLLTKSDLVVDTSATYTSTTGIIYPGTESDPTLIFGGASTPFDIDIKLQRDTNVKVVTGATANIDGNFDSSSSIDLTFGDSSGSFDGTFVHRMSDGGANFTNRCFNDIYINSGRYFVDIDRSVVPSIDTMLYIDISSVVDDYSNLVDGETVTSSLGWSGEMVASFERSGNKMLVLITSGEVADDVDGITQTLTTGTSGFVFNDFDSEITVANVYSPLSGMVFVNTIANPTSQDNAAFGWGLTSPADGNFVWAPVKMNDLTDIFSLSPNTWHIGDILVNGQMEFKQEGTGFNNNIRYLGNELRFLGTSPGTEIRWNVGTNGNYLRLANKVWAEDEDHLQDIVIRMDTSHNNAQFVIGQHMHRMNINNEFGIVVTSSDSVNADSRITNFSVRDANEIIPIRSLENVIFRTTQDLTFGSVNDFDVLGKSSIQLGNGVTVSCRNEVVVQNGQTLRVSGSGDINNPSIIDFDSLVFKNGSTLGTVFGGGALIPEVILDPEGGEISVDFGSSSDDIFINNLRIRSEISRLNVDAGNLILLGDTADSPSVCECSDIPVVINGTSSQSNVILASKIKNIDISRLFLNCNLRFAGYGFYDGSSDSSYKVDGLNDMSLSSNGIRPNLSFINSSDNLDLSLENCNTEVYGDCDYLPESGSTGGDLVVRIINSTLFVRDSVSSALGGSGVGTHILELDGSKFIASGWDDFSGNFDFGDFSSTNTFKLIMKNSSEMLSLCDGYYRYVDFFDFTEFDVDDGSKISMTFPPESNGGFCELYFRDRDSANNGGRSPAFFNFKLGEFLNDREFVSYNGSNTGTKDDPIHVTDGYSEIHNFTDSTEGDSYLYFQVDAEEGQEIRTIDTGDGPDTVAWVYTSPDMRPDSLIARSEDAEGGAVDFNLAYTFPAKGTYWVKITDYDTQYTEDPSDLPDADYRLVLQDETPVTRRMIVYVGSDFSTSRSERYQDLELNYGSINLKDTDGNIMCDKLFLRRSGSFDNASGKQLDVNEIVFVHDNTLQPDSGSLTVNCVGRVVQGTNPSNSQIKNISFSEVVNAVRVTDGGGNSNLHIRRP